MDNTVAATSARWLPGLVPVADQITRLFPADAYSIQSNLLTYSEAWMQEASAGALVFNSLLTPGGYPLEFAFRSGSYELAYTAEPGLPSHSVAQRWDFVKSITEGFDVQAQPLLAQLSADEDQRFGCWLSTRHRAGQMAWKVYQEVSPSAAPRVMQHLAKMPWALDALPLTPLLVGMGVGEAKPSEFYFRLRRADMGILHQALAVSGQATQLQLILSSLSYLANEQVSTLIPRLRLGISYRITADAPPELTLFAHAAQVFKTNLLARHKMLSLAQQLGQPMDLYEAFTEPWAHVSDSPPMHSMLHFKPESPQRLSVGIGWRPL